MDSNSKIGLIKKKSTREQMLEEINGLKKALDNKKNNKV
jgi:hypothetical protein